MWWPTARGLISVQCSTVRSGQLRTGETCRQFSDGGERRSVAGTRDFKPEVRKLQDKSIRRLF